MLMAQQNLLNSIASLIRKGETFPNCAAPTISASKTLYGTNCDRFFVKTDSSSNVISLFACSKQNCCIPMLFISVKNCGLKSVPEDVGILSRVTTL